MKLEEFRKHFTETEPGSHRVIEHRDGMVEAVHNAHIAVVAPDGRILFSSGDPHHVTYTRSCIKPIQALPILASGAVRHYGLTDEEIALVSGSHSGEPKHLEVLRSILEKGDIDSSLLKCGGHEPFDKEEAARIGKDFTNLHDNCSGKHAGALLLSKYKGWDLDSYLSPGHPLQGAIIEAIGSLTGLKRSGIHIGKDGCDIPNHAMPIDRMARMFALLADPGEHPLAEHLLRIGNSMAAYPNMVAGRNRFDTVLMEDLKGRVISKAGAVGLQTIAVKLEDRWVGVSLKLEDGAYAPIPPLTYHILKELGLEGGTEGKAEEFRLSPVRTRSKAVVGHIETIGRLRRH
ncbi:MAG: asparaginase [Thermoplasmatota archaeon]